MAKKLFAVALAMVMFVSPAHAEAWTCPKEQYVCDANNRAFACYIEHSRRFDDVISEAKVIARRIRIACNGMIEYAMARRWHSILGGDPKAQGVDEKWKIESADFLRKEGVVLQKGWYDEEMDKIVSVIMQLRDLRIKR